MDEHNNDRLYDLFQQALEAGPGERARVIDRLCPDDPDLRREVRSLLESHEAAGTFMDNPAPEALGPPADTATTPLCKAPQIRLDAIDGPELQTVLVNEAETTLGRSSSCRVRLLERTVSRRHATIARRPGAWVLTDQTSRLGTFLNGAKLRPDHEAELNQGDLIKIGPWTFTVSAGA